MISKLTRAKKKYQDFIKALSQLKPLELSQFFVDCFLLIDDEDGSFVVENET